MVTCSHLPLTSKSRSSDVNWSETTRTSRMNMLFEFKERETHKKTFPSPFVRNIRWGCEVKWIHFARSSYPRSINQQRSFCTPQYVYFGQGATASGHQNAKFRESWMTARGESWVLWEFWWKTWVWFEILESFERFSLHYIHEIWVYLNLVAQNIMNTLCSEWHLNTSNM